MPTRSYEETGRRIGRLVKEKNEAYGDSFHKSAVIMLALFPNGIPTDKYQDALAIVRIIDKLFRLATRKDAFGENPMEDIAGYAIVSVGPEEPVASDGEPASDPADCVTWTREDMFPSNLKGDRGFYRPTDFHGV